MDVAAAVAAAAAVAVVVVLACVLQAEDLGIVFAARLAVIDWHFPKALFDAVVDDVLHGDGRARRHLVLVTIAPAVDAPLVFLKVSFLPELVAALAAAERSLLVVGANLVLFDIKTFFLCH